MSIKISGLSNRKGGNNYLFSDLHLDLSETKTSKNKVNGELVAGNDLQIDTDENAIMNSIRNILTQKRYLEPLMNVNLKGLIGGTVTELGAKNIGSHIERAISLLENRVTLQKIFVAPNYDNYSYNIVILLNLPNLTDKKTIMLTGTLDNLGNLNFVNNRQ